MPTSPYILLGESPAMVTLRHEIANAARTNAKLLITGETGVGKEVVAGLVHRQGARRLQPFVPVNCTGIPQTLLASELFGHARGSFTGAYCDRPGLIRRAEGGTLFLDELGEMSLPMQAMLLRFAENGEIQPVGADGPCGHADVRLITATNADLRAQIAEGTFREDLYYRLNVIHITVPPLRERGSDVLLLLRHYIRLAAESHGVGCPDLTPEAETQLLQYAWPGNVRELRNVSERLALRAASRPITVDDLPIEIRGASAAAVAAAEAREAGERSNDETVAVVRQLWDDLRAGGDFWKVVQERFRTHELTREELEALVDRGLTETHGSYRALVTLFNLAPTEYKRFHAFLYQHNCNLPVARYRVGSSTARRRARMLTYGLNAQIPAKHGHAVRSGAASTHLRD